MLILASKSKRRIDILRALGYQFKIVPADIDENIKTAIPAFLPARLAELKAEKVGMMCPSDFVIGMDTIVFLENEVLGKPECYTCAEEYLSRLSDKWHSVISGACIININKSEKYLFSDLSRVRFKKLSRNDIRSYLDKIDPLDKAGGYAIQDNGEMIIDKVEGSIDNIIGFPTEKFLKITQFAEIK